MISDIQSIRSSIGKPKQHPAPTIVIGIGYGSYVAN